MRASSAAILRRLQALETMIAALLRPTPPSKLTQQSSPSPPPVGPHPSATTFPTPPSKLTQQSFPTPPRPVGPHAVSPPADPVAPPDDDYPPGKLTKAVLKATSQQTASQRAASQRAASQQAASRSPKTKAKADAKAKAPVAHDDYPPGKLYSLIRFSPTEALRRAHNPEVAGS